MGNSKYFDELIVSYLSNELNTEEEAFVLEWINSSEQNKQYFEELRNTWNLLTVNQTVKDINIDTEWNQFKQAIGTKQKEVAIIEPGTFDNEVIEEAKPNRRAKVYNFFISAAVAASMLVVIALGWRLTNNNATFEKPITKVNEEIHSKAPYIRYQLNTTDKPEQLVLQDGSELKLYGNSMISYHEPFTGNKRDITLAGEASFKVAKDKSKPFTVFSGDISTTALGTQFTVTAFRKDKNITVRLYEGKVVVKSANSAKRRLKNDYYLLPGQELVYNNKDLTAKVRRFRGNTGIVKSKKEKPSADILTIPENENGSWFMFNNQSLDKVFDELGNMYGVDIEYAKRDVYNRYFIGKFDRKDSVENIIKQIADLNNLEVIKKNNKFIIRK